MLDCVDSIGVNLFSLFLFSLLSSLFSLLSLFSKQLTFRRPAEDLERLLLEAADV